MVSRLLPGLMCLLCVTHSLCLCLTATGQDICARMCVNLCEIPYYSYVCSMLYPYIYMPSPVRIFLSLRSDSYSCVH